jgi:plasmid maintenance system antidote protein VapI
MAMHNPPHPGEFITDIYLEPNGISGREPRKSWMLQPLR